MSVAIGAEHPWAMAGPHTSAAPGRRSARAWIGLYILPGGTLAKPGDGSGWRSLATAVGHVNNMERQQAIGCFFSLQTIE